MCQSCQTWQGLDKQAWDEVFRLTISLKTQSLPFFLPQRESMSKRVLPMLKIDLAAAEREIYALAALCETILPLAEAQRLHSARVNLFQSVALRLHHLKTNVIDPSQEYLQLTWQLQVLYSYAGMLNAITQDWSDALSASRRAGTPSGHVPGAPASCRPDED